MDATAKCQGRSATRYAPCARPTFNPPISRRRRRRSLRRGPDHGCATSDLFADAPDDALDAAAWIEIAASRVPNSRRGRSEEHTSELQSQSNLVCRLLLEKKKQKHEV